MREKPNLLWIFGAQHRGQCLSIAGDPNVRTPNMDRMATEGLWFQRAVATNPWSSPFRFSLMTGRHAHEGIDRSPPASPLDPSLPTAATLFRDANYHTAFFGGWRLYGNDDSLQSEGRSQEVPMEHRGGFDTWIGYDNHLSPYETWVHGHFAGWGPVPFYRLPGYETDSLTDLLLEELDRRAEDPHQPFFAVLSVHPPHSPNVAPPENMRRHAPASVLLRPNVPPVDRIEQVARRELAGYHAQIENLDQNLGRVLAKLQDLNLIDNTHILFFSDHGDCKGSHGYQEMCSPWEESVRIPFLVAGGEASGSRRRGPVDAPLATLDILPTSLGLCGISVPPDLSGYDYSAFVWNKPSANSLPPPDSAYLQHGCHTDTQNRFAFPWRGIVTRDGWKFVCIPGAPWAMFNLNEDPFELANLAFNPRFAEKRRELQARLARWMEESGDHFELPQA